jgi:hypothetical protein
LLPSAAEAVVFVPRLGTALDQLQQLAVALAQVPQGEFLGQALDELSSQLGGGVKPDALPEALGLDRMRSMAVVLTKADLSAPQPWLALPVKDRKVLENRLAKLMAARLGAHDENGTHGGKRYLGANGSPVAALRYDDRVQGTALVAFGPQAESMLDSVLGLTVDASLARSVDYQACRSRWSDMNLWVFVAKGADLRAGAFGVKPTRGSGVGLAFGKNGLRARSVALLTVSQGALAAALATPTGDSRALAGLIPPAPLWWWLGVDPSTLAADPALLPAGLSAALRGADIEPRELLENIGPGVVLSLGLSDQPSFRTLPSLDPREANPFAFLDLRAACRVRNPDRARATLAKITAAGPSYGVTFRTRSVSGVEVQTAWYSQGESVSIALTDRTLLVTGGLGEMERAIAALAAPVKPQPPLDPKAVMLLRLDVPALLTQLEAAPSAAYGGFSGLTVRSLVTRVTSPLAHLGVVEVSLALDGDAAVGALEVPLR